MRIPRILFSLIVKLLNVVMIDVVAIVAPKIFLWCFVSLLSRFNRFVEKRKKRTKNKELWIFIEGQIAKALRESADIIEK